MKIKDLIDRLNEYDQDAYIHLFAKNTNYNFEVEREYPDSDFNYNLIIKIPDSLLYKEPEVGESGDEKEWMEYQAEVVSVDKLTTEEEGIEW